MLAAPRILGISPIARAPSGSGFLVAGQSLGGTVPLSEHEQRQLDQIERALYAEDPKFAHAVRSTNPQAHYRRRIVKAALGFVLGVCALMAGLVVNVMPITLVISSAGFLLMFFCCVWALSSWKRMAGVGAEPEPPKKRPGRPARGGFMERLEERWRRRSEGQ
jgi:hypothetical protein